MREHQVPDWYIPARWPRSAICSPRPAVAYIVMAFRIAWFKVHEPLAFYATFFSIRAKAFDAEYCCAGMDAVEAEDTSKRSSLRLSLRSGCSGRSEG